MSGLDPVTRALRDAPVDDEPITADDVAELEAADLDWKEGRLVPHAEASQQLLGDS